MRTTSGARGWWLLPILAAAALTLSACGQGVDAGPGSSFTTLPGASTSTTSESGAATPAEAIEVWMDGEGLAYAGECATTTIEDDLGKYCSSLCEDRGESQIHKVGPTFSEYTTWLLLERSGGTWSVTDTAEDTGTAPAPW